MNLGTSLIGNIDLILVGMFEDQYKAAKDLEEQQERFSKSMYENLRNVYDAYMPNVHVLDADNAAALIVAGIIENPEIILSVKDPAYLQQVKNAIIKAAPKLRKDIRESIGEVHAKFSKRTEGNPIRSLNANLGLYIRDTLRKNGGLLTNEDAVDIGRYFNNLINTTFPKNVALLGVSAESVGLVSKEHRYVFFQKSFVSGKDTINKNITAALKASLESTRGIMAYSNVIDSSDSVTGMFIDFGHVGVREDTKNSQVLINTPALTKIIYNVTNLSTDAIKVGLRDVNKAKSIFISKTGHTTQALTINKSFNRRNGILMSIGMTITTDMEAGLNRKILGGKERKISDRAVADRLNSSELMRRGLLERLTDTFLGKFTSKLIEGKSSPSIKDYITNVIADTLKGDATENFTQSLTKSKTNTIKIKVLKSIEELIPQVTKQPKAKTVPEIPKLRTLSGQFYSLNSLQQLISYYLQDVISANMGDGTRRDILNYRTGRFASTVKLEKVSQSREGMITAYYSYMRNPYATFAPGGRQERPGTRNPELLIAKSIREIAATKVANRMRAVAI